MRHLPESAETAAQFPGRAFEAFTARVTPKTQTDRARI